MSEERVQDYLQRYSAMVLWHFTGYGKTEGEAFEILKSIIQQMTLKVSEEENYFKMPNLDLKVGYKHCCLCDIPFKDLRIHTIRYSEFGIAFKKKNAVKKGFFNPVWYVDHDSPLFHYAGDLLRKLNAVEKENPDFHKFLRLIGAHVKSSNLATNVISESDEPKENNFYLEREWRSLYEWKFERDDVVAIMVKDESHISQLKCFLREKEMESIFENVLFLTHDLIRIL
jgi:hypothetical protein